MRFFLVAFAIVLAPTVVAGSDVVFSYQGGFLYGGLEAFYGPDACANGRVTDGIDSDCFDLPPEALGKPWRITEASDDTGVLATNTVVDVPPEVYSQTQPTHCSVEEALERDGNRPTDFCHSSTMLIYPLVGICFYTPAAEFPTGMLELIGCSEQPVVPENAGMAAVVAYPSLNVEFTFETYG